MASEIVKEHNRFSMTVDDLVCHIDFTFHEPTTVVFYHTFVPEDLRGQGLATKLIRTALDWAMEEKYDIIPACTAVRRFIDMNPDYKAYFTKDLKATQ